MEKHITILAVLHIIYSGVYLFAAALIFFVIVGGGLLSQDATAIGITSIVGTVIAGILLALGAPGVIGGIALLKRKSWSWILIFILGCLDLLSVPLGTAIGIYTIWVLVQEDTKKLLGTSF
ncbi:MAG: hypothetical protein J2P41_08460 [Blastocatellia bacterium]|nr:hypothetical protein [Blastocatellia bacterium]